jgi:hypothetical protein
MAGGLPTYTPPPAAPPYSLLGRAAMMPVLINIPPRHFLRAGQPRFSGKATTRWTGVFPCREMEMITSARRETTRCARYLPRSGTSCNRTGASSSIAHYGSEG